MTLPLEYYYNMIENIIRDFGVDPEMCKGVKPGQYDLKKGSASVWIDIWKVEDEDYGYIQILSPVIELPKNNLADFYQEILETNHKLYGVAMTKFENWIYMKSIRELEGLEENEARAMFNRVGNYADEYDDLLKSKYQVKG
ncbi:MAG: YbjN domain-containing protein [Cytophagales bacterium]